MKYIALDCVTTNNKRKMHACMAYLAQPSRHSKAFRKQIKSQKMKVKDLFCSFHFHFPNISQYLQYFSDRPELIRGTVFVRFTKIESSAYICVIQYIVYEYTGCCVCSVKMKRTCWKRVELFTVYTNIPASFAIIATCIRKVICPSADLCSRYDNCFV